MRLKGDIHWELNPLQQDFATGKRKTMEKAA
jgi:hypothetical protein